MTKKKCEKILWNKNAALTTQQIVVLIILITSFSILLFFLFRMNFQETADKEICRNSVVLRGQSVTPKEATSLKCQTNYVCITKDGSCEGLSYYSYKIDVSNKEELYSALAKEMADCWWMFGEGEINYVEGDMTKQLYCSICSQVTFDDSIMEIEEFSNGYIDKNDFYFNYLAKEEISEGKETYAEYLFGTKDVGNILKSTQKEAKRENLDYGEIDLSENYAIVMGITSDINKIGWAIGGGVVAAGIALIPFTGGLTAGVLIVAGGVAGGTIAGVTVEGVSGDEYLAPSIIRFPEDYDKLGCDHIVTLG